MRDDTQGYQYRAAFGAWINDMRTEPLPLENWPAPQFDDATLEGIGRALDVQAEAGFNLLDVWGLFATYGWPPDLKSALTDERRRRIHQVLDAAHQRGVGLVLGMGVYSWGYDRIIEADPGVRGKNPDGSPHPHAMCDANPKAFDYVTRILDFVLEQFDFDGVHLESCDLGCCMCPECAGGQGKVAYNVQLNRKTADYLRGRWPDKILYVIPISWIPPLTHFDAEQKASIVELSGHIDCFMDQGHRGTMVAPAERPEFIKNLDCAYGTSGGIWLYPDARWDRTGYFLPYPRRTGAAIREHYDDGARGCMFYQGPMINPGTEINVAVGGLMLRDPHRNVEEALAEALDHYYRPKTDAVRRKLVEIFQLGEEGYFGQWVEQRFLDAHHAPAPGEFMFDCHLFGTCPGPAAYLHEPFLDTAGRVAYGQALQEILRQVDALPPGAADAERLSRIRRSVIVTLMLLNTVAYGKGENQVMGW
ncbi:MAG: hypothetical protein HYU66_27630 [Armatimonadetes bacterium]|nr:hypothetical protein [Armatimonadota bacterium]